LKELRELNQGLGARVAELEEEACVCDAQLDRLLNFVNKLHATINSMMDWLCHCLEGKGKEREVNIKIEEESEGLEYASDGKYKTAPGTGEVVVRELVPIEQDLESRGILQEVQEACGCGLPVSCPRFCACPMPETYHTGYLRTPLCPSESTHPPTTFSEDFSEFSEQLTPNSERPHLLPSLALRLTPHSDSVH